MLYAIKLPYSFIHLCMKQILILNGPNLNLLGKREPDLYGNQSFDAYFMALQNYFSPMNVQLTCFQSNHEGELIDQLHHYGFTYSGIVFNPGGYTHTSIALADAIAAIPAPVVEVHISNTFAREPFRHHSYTAARAKGIIAGLGLEGYKLAVLFLLTLPQPH